MNTLKFLPVAFAIVTLAACGGGGGGGGTPPPPADTTAPTLNLPATIDAQESASGAGAVVTYTVTATDAVDPSPTVSCTPASGTTFTLGTTVVNCTATDASSNQSTGSFNINVVPPCNTPTGGNITLDGQVTFDKVPHDPATNGLDYASTTQAPARGVTVKAFNADTSVELTSTQTDGSGNFSMLVPDNTFVKIRVIAEMVKTGAAPTWQVQVRDNTSSNAQYVMDGSAACTTTSNQTRNLNAPSGWGGTGYTSARSAAPFAILDAVNDAVQLILTANSNANLPLLDVFWSTNNTDVLIGTSHWDGTAIYLLGDENNDTDEYDPHVIAHEFGHYLETNFSRTDNIGGVHFTNDRLDMRVSFSEGYNNAFSAMALGRPLYQDSNSTSQNEGFSFSLEDEVVQISPVDLRGWYNEISIGKVIYDIYDNTNDAADDDTVELGFAPLWQVFTNQLVTDTTFNGIHKFIHFLKQNNGGSVAAINNIMNSQRILVSDKYGSSESNDASNSYVTPIYFDITTATQNVCVTRFFGTAAGDMSNVREGLAGDNYNLLGMNHYVRFTPSVTGNYQFSFAGDTGSDPVVILYHESNIWGYNDNPTAESETFTESLSAGREYMLEVFDNNLLQELGASVNHCYIVSVTGP